MIPIGEWIQSGASDRLRELEKFFSIKNHGKTIELNFLSKAELYAKFDQREVVPIDSLNDQISTPYFLDDWGENQPNQLENLCTHLILEEKDPLKQIARILYLVPKIHPRQNGNGRMARLWASIESLRHGLAIPVGLPTNDFLMSEERIYWELRSAIAVGALWEDMLRQAHQNGIAHNVFFQSIFRGSPVEALTLVRFENIEDLQQFALELEATKRAPGWTNGFQAALEDKLTDFWQQGMRVKDLNEIERDALLREVTNSLYKKTNPSFPSVR